MDGSDQRETSLKSSSERHVSADRTIRPPPRQPDPQQPHSPQDFSIFRHHFPFQFDDARRSDSFFSDVWNQPNTGGSSFVGGIGSQSTFGTSLPFSAPTTHETSAVEPPVNLPPNLGASLFGSNIWASERPASATTFLASAAPYRSNSSLFSSSQPLEPRFAPDQPNPATSYPTWNGTDLPTSLDAFLGPSPFDYRPQPVQPSPSRSMPPLEAIERGGSQVYTPPLSSSPPRTADTSRPVTSAPSPPPKSFSPVVGQHSPVAASVSASAAPSRPAAWGQTSLRLSNSATEPSTTVRIVQPASATVAASVAKEKETQKTNASASCRYFANGYCKNGSKCPFIHDDEAKEKSYGYTCKFFASGTCKKGDKCPFNHSEDREDKSKNYYKPEFEKTSEVAKPAKEQKDTKEAKPAPKIAASSSSEAQDSPVKSEADLQREEAKKKKKEEKERRRKEERERKEREREAEEKLRREQEAERERQKEKERAEERERKKREKERRAAEEREKREREEAAQREEVLKQQKAQKEREEVLKSQKEREEKAKADRKRRSKAASGPALSADPDRDSDSAEVPSDQDEVPPQGVSDDDVPELVSEDDIPPELISEDDEPVPELVTDDEDEGEVTESFSVPQESWISKLKAQIPFIRPPVHYFPGQREEVLRIKHCTDYYQIMNVHREADANTIKKQKRKIAARLLPREGERAPSGVSEALKAVMTADAVLSNQSDRLAYDALLLKGQGTINTTISLEETPRGFLWQLARLVVVVVGLVLLLFVLAFKVMRSLMTAVASVVRVRGKRQTKWCENCRDYHVIGADSEGEIWEENGHYYLKKDGRVHDITDQLNEYIQSGLFEEDDEESDTENHHHHAHHVLSNLEVAAAKAHKSKKDKNHKKKKRKN
eukprot:TRINITY_DN3469_c0_g1_i1.p1 TRINITY_DN3469_c0_g1~~TRINITY_DN3469_c0_g1_i1.p1  ORF type:complete len:892 (+),score=228.33 TRINITY_DN3469_c0_g1_i1:421-3096(+)